MKNKLIKIITLTLTSAIIASSSSVMAEEDIRVYIDGKQIPFDVNPIIHEERTLVPMRAIFEALGAEVTWNQETMTASAVRGNDTLSITIDSKQLYKNNEAVELDVPAMIVGDRTLVPVRAISESFDCDVQWDGSSKSVIIKTISDETIEYINEKLGFSLQIPSAWKGYYNVKEFDDFIAFEFCGKSTPAKDGLFMFYIAKEKWIANETVDSITEIGTVNDTKYFYATSTDASLSPVYLIHDDDIKYAVEKYGEEQIDIIKSDGEKAKSMFAQSKEVCRSFKEIKTTSTSASTEIKYYSDFQTVPDFGACFGYEDDINGDTHFYEGTKEEDRKAYTDLLESLGFKKVDEMVTSQVESYGYEKDGVQIVTALYNMEAMKNVYGIAIHKTIEKYNGEIKFYKKYKAVPDIGVLDGVKLVNTSEMASNMTQYSYSVDANLESVLMYYLDMLEESGFSSYAQMLGSTMYVNNDTKNTVVIQMDIDSDNNSVLSIIVEQFIEE